MTEMISRAGFLRTLASTFVGGGAVIGSGVALGQTAQPSQGSIFLGAANYDAVRRLSKTNAPLEDRDQVFVQESGRLGAFYYDAADTSSADNDGTILVDDAGRRFKRLFEGDYFASWWGYRSDGSTKSSLSNVAALNAAIAAAHDLGGGTVNIGFGAGQIRAQIIHKSRVTLCGYAMGASQLIVDAANWQGSTGTAIITNTQQDGSEEDMVFRDFTLNGSGLNVPGGGAHGIRLGLVWRVGVYRIHFIDLENGTALVGCNSQSTQDCKFTLNAGRSANAAFDHWGGASTVKVSGCVVDIAQGASISQGIQVTGAGTDPAKDVAYSSDIQIYANSLQGVRSLVTPNGASAIAINALNDKSSAMRSIVTSNYVYDSDIPYVVSGRGGIHTFGLNTAEKCSNGGFQAGPDDTISPDNIALVGHKAIDCTTSTGAIINLNGGENHSVKACTVNGGTYDFAARIKGTAWSAETAGMVAGSQGVLDAADSSDHVIDGIRAIVFTPVLTLGGSSDGVAGLMSGQCTTIGNLVFIELSIDLTSVADTDGIVAIEDLPINDRGTKITPVSGPVLVDYENIEGTEGRQLYTRMDGKRRLVLRLRDGAAGADLTARNLTDRTSIRLSFSYIGAV